MMPMLLTLLALVTAGPCNPMKIFNFHNAKVIISRLREGSYLRPVPGFFVFVSLGMEPVGMIQLLTNIHPVRC